MEIHKQSQAASASKPSPDRDAPHSGATDHQAPSHDDIAKRAYDIYERTGRQSGQCQHNWQQAQDELSGCCGATEDSKTRPAQQPASATPSKTSSAYAAKGDRSMSIGGATSTAQIVRDQLN